MLNKNQYEKYFYFGILFGVLLLLLNLYYYAHPLWKEAGLSWYMLDNLCISLSRSPLFSHSLKTKITALVLISLGMLSKSSKAREVDLKIVAVVGAISAAAYLIPFPRHWIYVCFTILGCVGLIWVVSMIARRETKAIINDDNETFPQCEEKIETDDSINLPIVYQYQQKMHDGWINIVNPFRGILVLGSPGSGKSYSVYEPFIDQMMSKGYSMCVYDYKYPTLSKNVYNKLIQYRHKFKVKPEFCVLNFDDPMHSLRANPTHPSYILDQADCAEIAELIMLNINMVAREKNDFFTESSKALLDGVFWYLRTHEEGRYCTFPHAIEFLNQDYRKVIAILVSDPDVKTKISSFSDAFEAGANDQLQGMIASTRIPLSKFTSRNLYWVLTGDDFNLDINDPKNPKILCIGNNPDREIIYGTCIALYTSRMFKRVNHPGKLKCGVLLDEMPTIYLKGIDNLIATARSNKVAIVLGAQDKSQLKRDYGEKESEVFFNTVGNIFSGQVNGKTAEELSKSFGKEFRKRESQTRGIEQDSVSISFQHEELLPLSTIETLSQGVFFGKVADNNDMKIKDKFFCGEIQRDLDELKRKRNKWQPLPRFTDFGEEEVMTAVMKDRDNVLLDYFKALLRKGIVVYDDDELEDKAWEAISEMTPQEKQELLERIARSKADERVTAIVQENFKRVQEDIKSIIQRESYVSQEIYSETDKRMIDPFAEDK